MRESRRRICFILYANPGLYPPIDHVSRILADRGWRVLVLGIDEGGGRNLELDERAGREVRKFPPAPAGWLRPAHYLLFALWCAARAARFGAGWAYVSDVYACPAGWLTAVTGRRRSVYHEHDESTASGKPFVRACLWARGRLVRAAACVVAPNERRLQRLIQQTSGPEDRAHCVWNCPLRSELPGLGRPSGSKVFRVLYHGSVNDQRLPLQVVKAVASLPQDVRLRVVGYETIGHPRYFELLRAAARESGIEDRVEIVGALRLRDELLRMATESDLGLSLMPVSSQDPNLEDMVGASNKPFDYLACGLPLLVTRRKDWEEMYVAAGLARACAPTDAEDIAAQIRWFYEHRDQAAAMGRRGRELIRECWNYETQFEPVLRRLEEDRD